MAVGYMVALDSSTPGTQVEDTASFKFNITTTAPTDQTISYELWNVTAGEPPTGFPASGATDFGAAYSGTAVIAHGSTGSQLVLAPVADTVSDGNQSYELWVWTNGTSNITHTAFSGITVTDDDFGTPVFSTPTTFSAAENQNVVGTVTAAAGSGTVTYSIGAAGAGATADNALFAVDSHGALTFIANPDFENGHGHGATANDYRVEVTATVNGQATNQDLVVSVTNVDDTAPHITSAAAVHVNENTATVQTETATTDAASTGAAWSIVGGADASAFTINSSTGALSFVTAPDFEHPTDAGADNVYNLTVKALTAGGNDTQAMTVTVDNLPEPTTITSNGGQPNVFVHVSDDAADSTHIASVTATTDGNGNTPVLSLIGADAGDFTISGSGDITFVTGFSPDFQAPTDTGADNTYNFQVKAHTANGDAFQSFSVIVDDPNAPAGGSGGVGSGGGSVPYTPHVIFADDNGDSIAAGAQDTVGGGTGNDSIDGGSGDNVILAGDGNDVVRGFSGNDSIDGGDGNDDVNGNMGNDTVNGGNGADTVRGGQDNDSVYGGAGDDPHVNGNIGDDIVHGDDGNDTVYGGQGNDTVYGDAGNDSLSGDLGNDIMYGGAGADRFGFAKGGGADWIGDFNAAEGDHVVLAAGTAYTVSNYAGQVMITLSSGDTLGLANVPYASFSSDWITFV